MGHRADGSRSHRAHPHAVCKKRRQQLRRVHGAVQLENHDICFDGPRIEQHTRQSAETFGEAPRIDMILGEAAHMPTQREYSAGSDDPRLSHCPTHLLFEAPRLRYEIPGAGDRGADRGAESLSEVDPYRVKGASVLASCDAARHYGVHKARAIEVRAHTPPARDVRDRGNTRERPD